MGQTGHRSPSERPASCLWGAVLHSSDDETSRCGATSRDRTSASSRRTVERRRVKVLVTGAAGFIGSTTAELLVSRGHEVVALDNLASGRIENVPKGATFVEGDCGDEELIGSLGSFDACIHFAARIEPAESVKYPEVFFANNVGSTFHLLNALVRSNVRRFVFSSSCAVYGEQSTMPIDEDCPISPQSPYGQSKRMVEEGLQWLASSGRIRAATMRYFNAAGATLAHPERHNPEIHLIPIALEVAAGKRRGLEIYGGDYPTRDGTCVRDYVHVSDLAEAHLLAMSALDKDPSLVLNLGSGIGYSNREVVTCVKEVTGVDFEVHVTERRPGDPAEAIASNRRAREVLGWRPERSDLESMVRDAWSALRATSP
jgi:UDP-glucose 4-epimerase